MISKDDLDKLELKDGDIILVNTEKVPIGALLGLKTKFDHIILCVYSKGKPVKDCIDTVSLKELKAAIETMERVKST
jgi:hypothetical protein